MKLLLMTQSKLISKLLNASKVIHEATLRGSANYIVTTQNIGSIIKSGFIRTNRITQIEKILKKYE